MDPPVLFMQSIIYNLRFRMMVFIELNDQFNFKSSGSGNKAKHFQISGNIFLLRIGPFRIRKECVAWLVAMS